MRRSWLVQCRGWKRRPPGSARGMAWGCAGKRRPTISPIHTGRREMPGLHLQPQTRPPLLGPRASRALPPRGSGRVVRARHCNPTLHPAPAPGRWALEPAYSRAPPSSGPGARLLPWPAAPADRSPGELEGDSRPCSVPRCGLINVSSSSFDLLSLPTRLTPADNRFLICPLSPGEVPFRIFFFLSVISR